MLKKITCLHLSNDVGSVKGSTFHINKLKLPKIDKFVSDLEDWFNFWLLFKKVDQDQTTDNEEKFHDLIQSTSPGSKARIAVESFLPTAENYPKAVKALKSRFK